MVDKITELVDLYWKLNVLCRTDNEEYFKSRAYALVNKIVKKAKEV